MDKEITAFHGPQTAKVVAILTFFFLLLILVPVGLVMLVVGASSGGQEGSKLLVMGVVYMVLPLLYLLLTYALVRLYCWAYNKVAARFGGLRFNLEEVA